MSGRTLRRPITLNLTNEAALRFHYILLTKVIQPQAHTRSTNGYVKKLFMIPRHADRAIAFENLCIKRVNLARTVWLSRCVYGQVPMIFDLDATR